MLQDLSYQHPHQRAESMAHVPQKTVRITESSRRFTTTVPLSFMLFLKDSEDRTKRALHKPTSYTGWCRESGFPSYSVRLNLRKRSHATSASIFSTTSWGVSPPFFYNLQPSLHPQLCCSLHLLLSWLNHSSCLQSDPVTFLKFLKHKVIVSFIRYTVFDIWVLFCG